MSCLACGHGSTTATAIEDVEGRTWTYAGCGDCGSLALDPMPDAERAATFYSVQSRGSGSTKLPGLLDAVRRHAARRTARAATAGAPGAADPGRVLDLGCGDGSFLAAMAALGWSITGTELPGEAMERARRVQGLELVEGPLRPDTFPDASFDLVTCWHSLEHFVDAPEVLRSCRRLLRPEGRLSIEVPNVGSAQARVTGPHWFHLDPPRHVIQFTPQGLRRLLERSGFTVTRCRPALSVQMGAYGWLQSAANAASLPRDLLYRLLLTRGRTPGSRLAAAAAVTGGLLLAPAALVACLAEAAAGAGSVLRAEARLTPP